LAGIAGLFPEIMRRTDTSVSGLIKVVGRFLKEKFSGFIRDIKRV
jgi:hypothetical protein